MTKPCFTRFLAAAVSATIPMFAGDSIAGIGEVRVSVPPGVGGVESLQSVPGTPILGYSPRVAVTFTAQQGPQPFDTTAIANSTPASTTLPLGGTPYVGFATVDSGAQFSLFGNATASAINLVGAGRQGTRLVTVGGAGGTATALVSDSLSIYFSGIQNVTGGPTATIAPGTLAGQTNVSIATPETVASLPDVLGVPVFGQYAVNIRTSETRRITVGSQVTRSPAVRFTPRGGGTSYPLKATLTLRDPFNSGSSPPAFLNLSNFNDFRNNPDTPTFWTFPFIRSSLRHTGGALNLQEFLFDTGAQVTVLSEDTADLVGFDVGVDTPDFFVDVTGVGGSVQVPGFFLQRLELPVTGGDLVYNNIPVIVLNIISPATGSGFVPGIIGTNLFGDRDITVNMDPFDPYVRISNPITPQWNQPAGGNWSVDSNWQLGVPDGAELQANFLGSITQARTVTVDGQFTVGSITFDNTNRYTLAGTGSLAFQTVLPASRIGVVRGSHQIGVPLLPQASTVLTIDTAAGASLDITSRITRSTVDLTKTGPGSLRVRRMDVDALRVAAGSLTMLPGSGEVFAVVRSLTIDAGGTLAPNSGGLVIDYVGTSPLATITGYITGGRLVLPPASAGTAAIGFGEASEVLGTNLTWLGTSVDATTILLRVTRLGDTTLDGLVNFADLIVLARNYQSPGSWARGDLDYNGMVNFTDLLLMARNYDQAATLTGSFDGDWNLARSLVPEPALLSVVVGASVLLRRR